MHKFSYLIKQVIACFVISMTGLLAMEGDSDSDTSRDFIRTVPHPGNLPLFTEKFECFRSSTMITNDFLTKSHSQLVRRTILNVLAAVEFAPGESFASVYAGFEDPINKCLGISKTWEHLSQPFFHELTELYPAIPRKKKNLRAKVKSVVDRFIQTLGETSDVDSLELQLLCMKTDQGLDLTKIYNITQALIRLKQEEMALHYTLSFARQARNLKASGIICLKANQIVLGIATEHINTIIFAEHIINTRQIGNNIDAMETALRCMPLEGIDKDFVFSLVDQLVLADLREAAIHYLIELANTYLNHYSHEDPRSLYLKIAAYYFKAEKLGSIEAQLKRFDLKKKLGLVPVNIEDVLVNPSDDPDLMLLIQLRPVPLLELDVIRRPSDKQKTPAKASHSESTSSTEIDDASSAG